MPGPLHQSGGDMIHTTTEGQKGLPRYFAQVFKMSNDMNNGRCDFHLPDGRVFRAQGKNPGPVAELHVHNPDLFARLIREGDLGFCDSYIEGGWSTPDLQAFLDHFETSVYWNKLLELEDITQFSRLCSITAATDPRAHALTRSAPPR